MARLRRATETLRFAANSDVLAAASALSELRAELLRSDQPGSRAAVIEHFESAVDDPSSTPMRPFLLFASTLPTPDMLALHALAAEGQVAPLRLLVRFPTGVEGRLAPRAPMDRLLHLVATDKVLGPGIAHEVLRWLSARDLKTRYARWPLFLKLVRDRGFAEAGDGPFAQLLLEDTALLAKIVTNKKLRETYVLLLLAVLEAAGRPGGKNAVEVLEAWLPFALSSGRGRLGLVLQREEKIAEALRVLMQSSSPSVATLGLELAMLLPRAAWRDALLAAMVEREPTERQSALVHVALRRNAAHIPRLEGGPLLSVEDGRMPVDGELFRAIDRAAFYDLRGGEELRQLVTIERRRVFELASEATATAEERALAVDMQWFTPASRVVDHLPQIFRAWEDAIGSDREVAFATGFRRLIADRVWGDRLLDTSPELRRWYARQAALGELSLEETLQVATDERRFEPGEREAARAVVRRVLAVRARSPETSKTELLVLLRDQRLDEADRVHVAARLLAEHEKDREVSLALTRAFLRGALPDHWEAREPELLAGYHRRRLAAPDPEVRALAAKRLMPVAADDPDVFRVLLRAFVADPDPRVRLAARRGFEELFRLQSRFRNSLLDQLAAYDLPNELLDPLALLFLTLNPRDRYVRDVVERVVNRGTEEPLTPAAWNCRARLADLAGG